MTSYFIDDVFKKTTRSDLKLVFSSYYLLYFKLIRGLFLFTDVIVKLVTMNSVEFLAIPQIVLVVILRIGFFLFLMHYFYVALHIVLFVVIIIYFGIFVRKL